MKSNDIVFQVDSETAGIMEEISEQLFENTEECFDELSAELEKVSDIVSKLYDDF